MKPEFQAALDAASRFRGLGLVPLPSRMDRKGPCLEGYGEYRTRPIPESVYENWGTANLQLMTGVQTSGKIKIAVVDLDGEQARREWRAICDEHAHNAEGTWISETGGGGVHIYYRLPTSLGRCESRLIWGLWNPRGGPKKAGGWAKHSEIRLLADEALAVAPPSLHVKTGVPYRWVGKWNPDVVPLPAEAPPWLVEMPGLKPPKPASPPRGRSDVPAVALAPAWRHDRGSVLRSLPPGEKLRLARSWGLRLAGGSRTGQTWAACHAIDREDVTPSAGFCPETGVYHDFGGSQQTLGLFDLAVALGAFRNWQEAMFALAPGYIR